MEPNGHRLRAATTADATALVAVRHRAGFARSGDEEFAHHLGVPEGDDYFCTLIELAGPNGSECLGYCSAGGSRDDDRKAYGEIYELAVEPWAGAAEIRVLARQVVERLERAEYAGVIVWARPGSTAADVLGDMGFIPDPRAREGRDELERVTLPRR